MDDFVGTARVLIAVGFALMLVMLRLDAERFGTAEYYEGTRDGERPSIENRVAWYLLGIGLAVGIMVIHPSPQIDFFLGTGDRAQSVAWGLAYGLIGTAQAVIYAFLRYHRIRFPEVRSYPGALLNATVTAFIDEVAFRGALFGLLLIALPDSPTLANVIQAILYTLTTRLGAPGRDRYLFVLTIGIGLVGGYLTAADRRDRRGVRRARHHPLRGLPLHRPHRPAAAARPGGRGDRGATPAAAGLADRRLAGSGAAGSVTTAAAAPPVALYVHIPFCVSLCPYCDFVVYAGAAAPRPAQPGRGVRRRAPRGAGACAAERCPAFGPRRPLETVYLGGGTPSLLATGRDRAAPRRTSGHGFGLAAGRRGDPRGQPRARRARRRAGFGATRASRGSRIGAQSLRSGRAPPVGPATPGRGRRATRWRRHGRRASPRSALDLLYDVPDRPSERWAATLEAALALEPDHLSVYALTLDDPDAEGLTGAAGDHLPTTAGARRWRERARPAPGRRPRRGPVPRTRSSAWPPPAGAATRSATGRGPGHESRHNLVYWRAPAVRGDRAGRARLRWR